jgi:four helix bundle protein
MNDPEVSMSNVVAKIGLEAYSVAVEAGATVIGMVLKVPAPLKPIADQVIRSASSVPANLAEGHGRSGRDRLHHWRIAYASAKEVDAHIELLAAAGTITASSADQVRQKCCRRTHAVTLFA